MSQGQFGGCIWRKTQWPSMTNDIYHNSSPCTPVSKPKRTAAGDGSICLASTHSTYSITIHHHSIFPRIYRFEMIWLCRLPQQLCTDCWSRCRWIRPNLSAFGLTVLQWSWSMSGSHTTQRLLGSGFKEKNMSNVQNPLSSRHPFCSAWLIEIPITDHNDPQWYCIVYSKTQ